MDSLLLAEIKDDLLSLEHKVRHVRTAAGVRRYHQPVGSIILGNGHALHNLRVASSDRQGNITAVHGRDGANYRIRHNGNRWEATGGNSSNVVAHGTSEEDLLGNLDRHAGGHGGNRGNHNPAPSSNSNSSRTRGLLEQETVSRSTSHDSDAGDAYKTSDGTIYHVKHEDGKYVIRDKDGNVITKNADKDKALDNLKRYHAASADTDNRHQQQDQNDSNSSNSNSSSNSSGDNSGGSQSQRPPARPPVNQQQIRSASTAQLERMAGQIRDRQGGGGGGGGGRSSGPPRGVLSRILHWILDELSKRRRGNGQQGQQTTAAYMLEDLEHKARHVRTAAGVRRYNQPIGSIIVGGGGGTRLQNLTHGEDRFEGWTRVRDSHGREYDVGRDDRRTSTTHGRWVATTASESGSSWNIVAVGSTEDSAYEALDRLVGAAPATSGGRTPQEAANNAVRRAQRAQQPSMHPNITPAPSRHEGWERFRGQDGNDYYVTQSGRRFSVSDSRGYEISSAPTRDAALNQLNDHAAPLPANLTRQTSDYEGWERFQGANGETYYVGQQRGRFAVTNAQDEELSRHSSREEALQALSSRAAAIPIQQTPSNGPYGFDYSERPDVAVRRIDGYTDEQWGQLTDTQLHEINSFTQGLASTSARNGYYAASNGVTPDDRRLARRVSQRYYREYQRRQRARGSSRPPPSLVSVTDSFGHRLGSALSDEAALDSAPLSVMPRGIDNLTDSQRGGLFSYRAAFYQETNHILRHGVNEDYHSFYTMPTSEAQRIITGVDSAMASSRLPRDVVTYRGLHGRVLFGDRLRGDMTGFEWREDAYVSTTTAPHIADRFSNAQFAHEEQSRGPVMMRVLAPAGVGGVQLSGREHESELLLERGLGMRVIQDRGVDERGVRLLDVMVIPTTGRT